MADSLLMATSWIERDENAGVLRYFAKASPTGEVDVSRPPPNVDRWRLGTHPDVVDWLWDSLNGVLPADARYLVVGGPALVEPASGIVLAVGLGTEYAVRLEAPQYTEARAAGFEVVHHFRTLDVILDLAQTLGPRWVFGRFDAREPDWLAASYRAASHAARG